MGVHGVICGMVCCGCGCGVDVHRCWMFVCVCGVVLGGVCMQCMCMISGCLLCLICWMMGVKVVSGMLVCMCVNFLCTCMLACCDHVWLLCFVSYMPVLVAVSMHVCLLCVPICLCEHV